MLHDRAVQLDAITTALDRAAGRRGSSLVLSGRRGAGFSALLDAAVRTARSRPQWLVVQGRAAPSETSLENALLQQLVQPLVDELDRLAAAGEELAPAPRAALDTVTGWAAPGPAQVQLSMAVLWALEAVARHRPVLVAVDDVPWGDRSSLDVLHFLCRRLSRTAVCLLLAAPGGEPALDWPDADVVVDVTPLDDAAAESVLAQFAPDTGPVSRERVLRLADGRPRRLVDLGRLAQVHARSSSTWPLRGAALPWVQRAVVEVQARPPAERRRLLLAGLLDDPAGAPHARRAERLLGDGDPGGGVPLFHAPEEPLPDPLLVEVAAEDVDDAERRRAQRAWAAVLAPAAVAARAEGRAELAARLAAEASRQGALVLLLSPVDDEGDPEQPAATRAGAAAGLREAAAELARRDPRRAGDLHVLASQLEDDDDASRTDLLRAAESAFSLGRTSFAEALAERAGTPRTPLAEALARRVEAVRALRNGEREHAIVLLVEALERCVDDATGPAGGPGGEAVLTAVVLVVVSPRSAGGPVVDALGAAAARLPGPAAHQVRTAAALLLPWRDAEPVEQLEALVEVLEVLDRSPVPVLRWAADVARALGRGDLVLAVARSRAAHLTGPAAVDLHLARYAAHLDSSIGRAEEHVAAARAHLRHAPETALSLEQAQAVVDVVRWATAADLTGTLPPVEPRTTETDGARWAHAQSHRLRGEVQLALDALRPMWADGQEPSTGALVSSIPFAASLRDAGAGADPAELRHVLEHVGAWARGSGAPLARVSWLLCSALSSADPAVQEERLAAATAEGGPALVTGTADLALGMLLRRARRAVDAREPLQRAAMAFAGAGMPGFARTAERELAATAPQRPLRRVGSRELTSQEREVAHLAAQGASNAEVALSLGISSRTVAHHLQKVYAKLGIAGRQQLAGRLDRV